MADTAVSRTATRWTLRVLVVGYLLLLVIWPVALVARETFAYGLAPVIDALRQPEVIFAFQLTLSAAFWAVVINTIFGVGISLLLVRYTFPGRRTLNALVDLPLAVSPVVVGLSLVLVYSGRTGWLGGGLEQAGLQIIYAPPGIILATAFVSMPLVIREVDSRAPRDRDRAGAGRQQPGRFSPTDLRSHHLAGHPLGTALWRGAQSGPISR